MEAETIIKPTPLEVEIISKITPLSERKRGESEILLYYGPSGSGKTFFCGTAGPQLLFINIGHGQETLLSPHFTKRYPSAKDMLIVDVNESLTISTAFDEVTDIIDTAMKFKRDRFDTIALDDATFLRRSAMNKAIELNTRKAREGKKPTEEYIKPDPGDYGVEMQIVEWFLATYIPIFKQEGINFIMTAHERHIYKKGGDSRDSFNQEPVLAKVLPGFTGKTFPDQVPAYFDDVFHSEVVGGQGNQFYRCQTVGSEVDRRKSRHGGIFEGTIVNPNFRKMLTQIREAA